MTGRLGEILENSLYTSSRLRIAVRALHAILWYAANATLAALRMVQQCPRQWHVAGGAILLHRMWTLQQTQGAIQTGAAEIECLMIAEEATIMLTEQWPTVGAKAAKMSRGLQALLLEPKRHSLPSSLGVRAQGWMRWHQTLVCCAMFLGVLNLIYRSIHAEQQRREQYRRNPPMRSTVDPPRRPRELLRIREPAGDVQPPKHTKARHPVSWHPPFTAPLRMDLQLRNICRQELRNKRAERDA